MSKRRIRFALWTSSAVFGGAAILVIVLTARMPLADAAASANLDHLPGASQKVALMTSVPNAADFAALSQLNLRRPLRDPPPPRAQPIHPPAPPPPLKIRLTGTIIEPDRKQAVIAMSDGQVTIKSVGDEAEGARILAIDERSITVNYFGQSVVLALAKGDGT